MTGSSIQKFDNDCDVICVQNVIKDRVYVTYCIVFHRVLGSQGPRLGPKTTSAQILGCNY